MHPTAVILVVGLNRTLLQHAPRLRAFAGSTPPHRLKPVLPAVTCSVQASMLTGVPPAQHGIVGNGWYNHEQAEIQFWKQSNRLVQAPQVWETARRRDPSFTCAQMFWWYNMYAKVDWAVTPRPIYKADGRKLPDIHTHPADLRTQLQEELGQFPLFNFWGPMSSIASSRWITDATIWVHERHRPTLTLAYLPHLDYALQKFGPEHPSIPGEVAAIDAQVGRLLDHFAQHSVRPIVLSEYGIEPVDQAIPINRILRQAGLLEVREEQGGELLDAGASRAFAVADHQVAHVYVNNPADLPRVRELCRGLLNAGVEEVLDAPGKIACGLDHARTGDLVLVAAPRRWFSYYYWLTDAQAPDFAHMVEIHRKPGYDPAELFVDPRITLPHLQIAWKLLRRKLGFRTLLDVISLDASLVRGSHGRVHQPADIQPILLAPHAPVELPEELPCTAVCEVILEHIFDTNFGLK